MTKGRLILLVTLLATAVACSSGSPEGTGAQSSGTPLQQGSASGNSNSDPTGSASSPTDVTQSPTVTPPAPVCGNGAIEAGEQCDDGNAVSGDGCSSSCKTESCGDGIVQAGLGEECDGSNLNGSTCSTFGYSLGSLSCGGSCKFVKSGCSNPPPAPVCGNGAIEAGEQCDDGNVVSGDGCSSSCKTESCGDGIIQAGLGEECDGPNLNGSTCSTFGYSVGSLSCGSCKFVKTGCSAVCGNGVKETGEQCDDGNTKNWDGCTSACLNEAAPTVSDNFITVTDALWNTKSSHGVLTFAATDALAPDQKIAQLTFSGGQTNAAGPGNSTQISTKSLLGFGMYRARVNFAKCAASEELVNGIFMYSYGGTNGLPVDSNGNAINDNNEIDFELLCGEPTWLWLTSWTDYTNDTSFRKVSRVFDLTTGKAYQTTPGLEGQYNIDWTTVVATIPEMNIPTLATANTYYEIGFDWHATALRFFIVLNGQEVTLWNFTNSTYIPQNKAFMMFNLWYTANHWMSGNPTAYPANPASLKVDWFKFWQG